MLTNPAQPTQNVNDLLSGSNAQQEPQGTAKVLAALARAERAKQARDKPTWEKSIDEVVFSARAAQLKAEEMRQKEVRKLEDEILKQKQKQSTLEKQLQESNSLEKIRNVLANPNATHKELQTALYQLTTFETMDAAKIELLKNALATARAIDIQDNPAVRHFLETIEHSKFDGDVVLEAFKNFVAALKEQVSPQAQPPKTPAYPTPDTSHLSGYEMLGTNEASQGIPPPRTITPPGVDPSEVAIPQQGGAPRPPLTDDVPLMFKEGPPETADKTKQTDLEAYRAKKAEILSTVPPGPRQDELLEALDNEFYGVEVEKAGTRKLTPTEQLQADIDAIKNSREIPDEDKPAHIQAIIKKFSNLHKDDPGVQLTAKRQDWDFLEKKLFDRGIKEGDPEWVVAFDDYWGLSKDDIKFGSVQSIMIEPSLMARDKSWLLEVVKQGKWEESGEPIDAIVQQVKSIREKQMALLGISNFKNYEKDSDAVIVSAIESAKNQDAKEPGYLKRVLNALYPDREKGLGLILPSKLFPTTFDRDVINQIRSGLNIHAKIKNVDLGQADLNAQAFFSLVAYAREAVRRGDISKTKIPFPIREKFRGFFNALGYSPVTAKEAQVTAVLGRSLAVFMQTISGAAVSDQEVIRLSKTTLEVTDPIEIMLAKADIIIANTFDTLEQNYSAATGNRELARMISNAVYADGYGSSRLANRPLAKTIAGLVDDAIGVFGGKSPADMKYSDVQKFMHERLAKFSEPIEEWSDEKINRVHEKVITPALKEFSIDYLSDIAYNDIGIHDIKGLTKHLERSINFIKRKTGEELLKALDVGTWKEPAVVIDWTQETVIEDISVIKKRAKEISDSFAGFEDKVLQWATDNRIPEDLMPTKERLQEIWEEATQ